MLVIIIITSLKRPKPSPNDVVELLMTKLTDAENDVAPLLGSHVRRNVSDMFIACPKDEA